jgi:hypothetical protein
VTVSIESGVVTRASNAHSGVLKIEKGARLLASAHSDTPSSYGARYG